MARSKGAPKKAPRKKRSNGAPELTPAPHLLALPLADLRAVVAASKGELDHRATIIARAKLVLSAAEHSTDDAKVTAALEALARAWDHYAAHEAPKTRPRAAEDPQRARELRAIRSLDWGVREAASYGAAVDGVALVACILANQEPSIPADRWCEALTEWRGAEANKRGRPKKGATLYRWDHVLIKLLHGEVDDPDDVTWRDNFLAWQRARKPR